MTEKSSKAISLQKISEPYSSFVVHPSSCSKQAKPPLSPLCNLLIFFTSIYFLQQLYMLYISKMVQPEKLTYPMIVSLSAIYFLAFLVEMIIIVNYKS